MKKIACFLILLIIGLILEVDSDDTVNSDNIGNQGAGTFDIRPAVVAPKSSGQCQDNEVFRGGKCRPTSSLNW